MESKPSEREKRWHDGRPCAIVAVECDGKYKIEYWKKKIQKEYEMTEDPVQ